MPDRGRADEEVMTHTEYPSCVNFRQEIMLSGMCWQIGDILLCFVVVVVAVVRFCFSLSFQWMAEQEGLRMTSSFLLLLLILFSNCILHYPITVLLWCGRFLVLLCFPVFLQVRRNQVSSL